METMHGVIGWNPLHILAGVIWALALGFAFGNYACSAVHRLPRGRSMLEKKPYCGVCGTMLQTRDLFPVISALLLRHRCRYCRAPIPKSHFWTEVLVGALFVLGFLQYNFGEDFILLVTLGVFLIILASIQNNEGFLSKYILAAVFVAAMLLRTRLDGSIYNFFAGGFFAFALGMFVWSKEVEFVGHRYTVPDGAKLMTAGGTALGLSGLLAFCFFFAVFYGLMRLVSIPAKKPIVPGVSFGMAVILPLLYPDLQLPFNLKLWMM